MFCPACGIVDTQSSQFCRACGSDLRSVRSALEKPDNVTASAVSARDEIGHAVAVKIRETQSAYELKKVAEDILPQIEKFLESPEERRLRRVRIGSIIASAGAGTTLGLFILGSVTRESGFLFLACLGLVTFFVGLGFIFNGIFLTVPKKSLKDKSSEAESQRDIDGLSGNTNDLQLPQPVNLFSSVTEHTTQHLKENQPISRD